MAYPKAESIQPLSAECSYWMPTTYCKILFYKAEEMLLIVPYVQTTPVGRIQEVSQEVN